jgi:hypothetical protein
MAQKGSDLCSAGAQALLLVDTLRTLGQLQVHGRVDRGIAGASEKRRTLFFECSFPMFVPSLSWQNDRF